MFTVAALAGVALAGSVGVESAAAGGNPTTWSCTSTTSACSFTVPSDVYGTASIVVDGAQGASNGGSEIGGDGAAISATYKLPAGASITAYVGGAGAAPSGGNPGSGGSVPPGAPAGLGGGSGGRSQYDGGSGGGSSTALYLNGTLLVVAGGGGGAGGEGVDDPTPVALGGGGGTPFVDSGDGLSGGGCNNGSQGGDGGTNGTGGAGSAGGSGNGCFDISTTAGEPGGSWGSSGGGSGGAAPDSDGNGHAGGGGGGGGGGFGGGGGAGAGAGASSAGGGGAGGSYVSPSLSAVSETGTNTGNGSVTITYSTGTAPQLTSPLSASASAGSSISIGLQASGEPAPTFSESGPLPGGITLSSSGLLSGTLGETSAGTWPIALSATNSVGTDTVSYTLGVTEPASYTGASAVLAGSGSAGTSENGTPAASAALDDPSDVVLDASGDRFVLNTGSSTVYEIPATSTTAYGIAMVAGEVYDIAGTGSPGDSGDSGPGHLARLDHPEAIALDRAGDLFVADTGDDTIRVLAAKNGCLLGEAVSAGDIYTVIGTPEKAGYYGDGGPASDAELDAPAGVALDAAGDVFVADSGNDVVREVPATSSCSSAPDIGTLAGTGSPASFTSGSPASASPLDDPTSLAVGPDADLYLDDAGADVVAALSTSSGTILGQSVTAGHLYVLAGDGSPGTAGNGGPASSAELDDPGGIALDAAGDLYLTDPVEGDLRVVASSRTTSLLGIPTSTGDIYQLASKLTDPLGIALDPSGAAYLAEGSAEDLALVGIAPELTSASSDSMQAGVASSFSFSASGEPAPSFTESGALPSGLTLSSSGVLSGTPALGSAGSYPITVRAGNGLGAVASKDFALAVTAAATTLGVALSPRSPLVASRATLTVTVSPTPDATTTVSVSDDKGWFDCPSAPVSTTSGSATCTSATLTSTATDQLSVTFNGDNQYASSSGSTTLTPGKAPTVVSLSANQATPSALSTTTLAALVSPTPDGGDVAFSDADGYANGCGEVPVIDGVASCTTATLAAPGTDTFSATYLGDADYEPSAAGELALGIAKAESTLGISTEPSPLVDASPGTVVARLSGADGPIEGGSVGFSDTAGNIAAGSCSNQPVSGGAASCTLGAVLATSDTITAAYSGDSLYAPATLSAAVSPTRRSTSLGLSVSTGALVVGEQSVLTATLDQKNLSGTVAFSDTGGLVAGCSAVRLDAASGTASCTTALAGATGTDTLTALYSGDADDASSSTSIAVAIDTEPQLASPTSYTAAAGGAFSATLETSGTPAVVAISLAAGSLPPGLSLVEHADGTATISGSIASDGGGVYAAEVALDDGVLAPASERITVTVDEAPSFTTTSSGACVVGAACDISVSAAGYPAPSLSAQSSLPSGLTFVDEGAGNALVSGTPGEGDLGSSTFAITAANSVGSPAVLHFTLSVTPAPTEPGGGGSTSSSGAGSTSSPSGPGATSSAGPGSAGPGAGTSSSRSGASTPSAVISFYRVSVRLSGPLHQSLSCRATPTEVHDDAGAPGSISELGLELSCRSGAIAATLAGSATARHVTVRVKLASRTVSRRRTLWRGGLSLKEPKRRLELAFSLGRVSISHALVVVASATSTVVVGHGSRTYHLSIRIAPEYSTT